MVEVEVKLRLPDAAAHAKLAQALQPGYKATYQQVGCAGCCGSACAAVPRTVPQCVRSVEGLLWPCWGAPCAIPAAHLLLPKVAAPALLAALKPSTALQENFFFDGAQQELSKERVVLRVGAALACQVSEALQFSGSFGFAAAGGVVVLWVGASRGCGWVHHCDRHKAGADTGLAVHALHAN